MTTLIICATLLISLGIVCGTTYSVLTCHDRDSLVFKILDCKKNRNG